MILLHMRRKLLSNLTSSVQLSPLTDWVIGDTRETIQQRFSSSLFCRMFDIVNPALPVPTAELSTLHGALKDGFGEAVMALHLQSVINEEV